MSNHQKSPENAHNFICIARNAGTKLLATLATMGSSAIFAVMATRFLVAAGFGTLLQAPLGWHLRMVSTLTGNLV